MDFLSITDAELLARSTWIPNIDSLEFIHNPIEVGGTYQVQHLDQLRRPNIGLYALKVTPKNRIYLEHENRLCDILDTLESMESSDTKEDMEDWVLQELVRINQLKEVEWSGQQSKRGAKGAIVNTGILESLFLLDISETDGTPESYFLTKHPTNTTLLAIYVTTLVMYVLFRLPRRGAAVLLAGMRSILKSEASLRSLASEVPKDPRKLLTVYFLDPITRTYVCCPSCYYLYNYSIAKSRKRRAPTLDVHCHVPMEIADDDLSGDAQIATSVPVRCTHHRIRTGPACDEPLFHSIVANGKSYEVPRCKYEMQDLKQWIGWLLSRASIEEHIFKAFRRPRKDYMVDMWDAEHLCRILLKEGERFLPGPTNETRLAFSFSMDSFNPYHMKEAKQTVSSTAIWLILLNLPSHLRYRPENMFLAGTIPGPRKPSLSDINHSLDLLVEVLLELFDPGVCYSRTARHNKGCRVRAILVPVVSDMLAARQARGFPSPTATRFCTCCNLRIQDIENLDRHTWPQRDVVEHIQLAKRWRDAESPEKQETLFRNHGIRWSPLLRLPYWNPILFTAIEPMHVFNVGLFQTHCRQVWGIDVSAPSGDGTFSLASKDIPRPSDAELEKWYETIRMTQNPERLRELLNGRSCTREILWHICNDHDLRRAGNKQQLIEAVTEWVGYLCELANSMNG